MQQQQDPHQQQSTSDASKDSAALTALQAAIRSSTESLHLTSGAINNPRSNAAATTALHPPLLPPAASFAAPSSAGTGGGSARGNTTSSPPRRNNNNSSNGGGGGNGNGNGTPRRRRRSVGSGRPPSSNGVSPSYGAPFATAGLLPPLNIAQVGVYPIPYPDPGGYEHHHFDVLDTTEESFRLAMEGMHNIPLETRGTYAELPRSYPYQYWNPYTTHYPQVGGPMSPISPTSPMYGDVPPPMPVGYPYGIPPFRQFQYPSPSPLPVSTATPSVAASSPYESTPSPMSSTLDLTSPHPHPLYGGAYHHHIHQLQHPIGPSPVPYPSGLYGHDRPGNYPDNSPSPHSSASPGGPVVVRGGTGWNGEPYTSYQANGVTHYSYPARRRSSVGSVFDGRIGFVGGSGGGSGAGGGTSPLGPSFSASAPAIFDIDQRERQQQQQQQERFSRSHERHQRERPPPQPQQEHDRQGQDRDRQQRDRHQNRSQEDEEATGGDNENDSQHRPSPPTASETADRTAAPAASSVDATSVASSSASNDRAEFELMESSKRFYVQATAGCPRATCTNPYCGSNPAFIDRDAKEAALLAVTLAQYGDVYACADVPTGDDDPNVENMLHDARLLLSAYQESVDGDAYSWGRLVATSYKDKARSLARQLPPAQTLEFIDIDIFNSMLRESLKSDNFDVLTRTLFTIFGNVNKLSKSFRVNEERYPGFGFSDVKGIKDMYESITEHCPSDVTTMVLEGTKDLLGQFCYGLEVVRERHVSLFTIILLNPMLIDPHAAATLMPGVCQTLANISKECRTVFSDNFIRPRLSFPRSPDPVSEETQKIWLTEDLRRCTVVFQQYITMRLLARTSNVPQIPNKDESVGRATECLELFYDINDQLPKALIPFEDYYNDAVNEQIDVREDMLIYKSGDGFAFCRYPYILNPAIKTEYLKTESVIQMRHELQDAFFRAMFIGVNSPYLTLEIRRDHLIRDAMFQLDSRAPQDMKKQLKVQFIGEEGVDEGGVQKEFFQLVVRELFDEKYGMFAVKDGSQTCWFVPDSNSDEFSLDEHRLIGRLLGLAIYNGVILDLHFPMALYKKLKIDPVDLDDLKDIDPDLHRGLATLLNFEGDVQEAYDRTFSIEYDSLSHRFTHDLKPNGNQIQLTKENRVEYVNLYVDFLLNSSVERQFNAFREGFELVCDGSSIHLFRAEELELLICGSDELDFQSLEQGTGYENGYEPNHPVIRWFWGIVHNFTPIQKKKLLFFTTGSDRVPIGGLSKLQMVVARNGGDSDRLPTSHTCFNVLLLCEYATEARLRDRLLCAIENAEGFGLI